MILGVFLHGALSYTSLPVPDLLWHVHDRGASLPFDVLFWWIHGFRLPLFFLLSGFFSAMMCETRGPSGFLRQRTNGFSFRCWLAQ